MARDHHPDRSTDDADRQRRLATMQSLNEARDYLIYSDEAWSEARIHRPEHRPLRLSKKLGEISKKNWLEHNKDSRPENEPKKLHDDGEKSTRRQIEIDASAKNVKNEKLVKARNARNVNAKIVKLVKLVRALTKKNETVSLHWPSSKQRLKPT